MTANDAGDDMDIPSCFTTVLLAIVSPLPINVVIIYPEEYFSTCCKQNVRDHIGWSRTISGCVCAGCERDQPDELQRFKELGAAYRKRSFRLVLCAEVPGQAAEYIAKILERNVERHKDGELGYLLSGASVVTTMPHI